MRQKSVGTGHSVGHAGMGKGYQNTQNRDSRALHLKLDELIRSVQTARNEMVGLEDLSDDDLERLQKQFTRVREHAEERLHKIQEHRSHRRGSDNPHGKSKADEGTIE